MNIELTEEQRRLVQEGRPIDVVDPVTKEVYVLVAKQRLVQDQRLLSAPASVPAIPDGIRCSQEALRRDLPQLLQQQGLLGQWVAYHRHERIGIAGDQATLVRTCLARGLDDDEFYVGWIHPCELAEEEEVEPRRQHYEHAHETP